MVSKMISIREDIYMKLKNLKAPNESFSDFFDRLLKNRIKNPLDHFGNAKIISETDFSAFENSIEDARRIHRERYKKRNEIMDD